MKVAPFLLPVQPVIGGVHVQHDFRRRLPLLLHKQVQQQRVQLVGIGHDPLVAVLPGPFRGAQLEPVQRTRAGQRMPPVALARATLPGEVSASQREGQQAVRAQGVVVVDILVAEDQREHALGDQIPHGMFAAAGIAVVGEAGGDAPGELEDGVGGAQQQGPSIGGHATTVKGGDDLATTEVGVINVVTLCGHEAEL